ncbi:MAG: methyl-accepting chemotaxis protein [Elusimicrobia bacterium]|nr:methyl-accepting chemotaxis protein [Elusimicrobiota bacterium]
MDEPKKFKRRIILIKKSIQLKYVALVFLSVVAAVFVIGGDVYYTVTKILIEEVNPDLHPLFTRFNQVLAVKLLIYLGIIFFVSLYVSHRIAGPIYRFEKSTRLVGEGDLTHRVSLRKGDELGGLEEEFNRMVASLQLKVQKDRNLAQHIMSRIEQIAVQESSGTLQKKIQEIRREMDHLGSGFKA